MVQNFQIHLQDQVAEIVRSYLGTMQHQIAQVQSQVQQTFNQVLEQSEIILGELDQNSAITDLVKAISEQMEVTKNFSNKSSPINEIVILKNLISDIQAQQNQADILNTLMDSVHQFIPRAVLFIMKAGNGVAWTARGFENRGGNESVRGVAISLQSDTLLKTIVGQKTTFFGNSGDQVDNFLLFSQLGEFLPERVAGIPLIVRSKTAAVLYLDTNDEVKDIPIDLLEILVHVAGFSVDLVSMRSRTSTPNISTTDSSSGPSTGAMTSQYLSTPDIQATSSTPDQISTYSTEQNFQTPSLEAETSFHGLVPTVSELVSGYSLQSTESESIESKSSGQVENLSGASAEQYEPDFSTQDFNRVGEDTKVKTQIPTFAAEVKKTEISSSEFESSPAISESTFPITSETSSEQIELSNPSPSTPIDAIGDDEQRLHNDARRFARLLISEIKLYNESKVHEGRRNNDLYLRLKEDIDRSRQMYDKRVNAVISARFDYFYDELVSTLGEGDTSKLGQDCPGPSVTTPS